MDIVADLHLHSTCSDGLYSPAKLAGLVEEKGLKVFSLTDHDSVAGLTECRQSTTVTFIPGIELTATEEGKEIHILGYFINAETPELLDTLGKIEKQRATRLFEIVDRLNERDNLSIEKDELAEQLRDKSFNRLNLARFLVEKGVASTIDDCFRNFIGDSSDAYRPVDYFSPRAAIKLIHNSGGLAFLAHPYLPGGIGMIPDLVEHGLDGVEAFHPGHKPNDVGQCLEWAKLLKIGVSGGSDFHGFEGSSRKILSAGLNGERLVDFLALNPNKDYVTV